MSTQSYPSVATFQAHGVLFDMDGTLTDSIAAVEAAWTAKADELGLEPEAVIAATHGRRASDNLMELVPGLRKEMIEQEVDKFERSILAFADTPPQSRRMSLVSRRTSGSAGSGTTRSSIAPLTPVTPADQVLSPVIERTLSDMSDSSEHTFNAVQSKEFTSTNALTQVNLRLSNITSASPNSDLDSPFLEEEDEMIDMAVRILPGVRDVINSLPKGTYAVATSGARTYCHGCLTRTNITIPDVCVTADDSRLTRGKPFPDPFLLAAADLGIDPKRSVIFEDSPSGIKAAVAAGGTVIAVCTSHKREQIDKLGAHYVVDTMEQVKVTPLPNGELEFTVAY